MNLKNSLEMFCLTLEPEHLDFIKSLKYTPVGLGRKKFPDDCISDNTGENISEKISIMENILFIIGYGKII